jgi:hypothetical protein
MPNEGAPGGCAKPRARAVEVRAVVESERVRARVARRRNMTGSFQELMQVMGLETRRVRDSS